MLFGILGVSLFGDILACKGMNRSGEEFIGARYGS